MPVFLANFTAPLRLTARVSAGDEGRAAAQPDGLSSRPTVVLGIVYLGLYWRLIAGAALARVGHVLRQERLQLCPVN